MDENPYQAPRFDELPRVGVDTGRPPDATALTEPEIRAFVGKNADYYIKHWPHPRDEFGRARGFNWAAFFLSGLWIPYRKMYRVALVIFGVIFFGNLVDLFGAGMGDHSSVRRISSLIVGIVCGTFGNAWYLAHARREVARVRALGLEGEAYYQALARRGGTSVFYSIGLFLLFVIALVVLGLVIEIALQSR